MIKAKPGVGQNWILVMDTTNWVEILSGGEDSEPWIRLSPERVACLSLEDCADQLERCASDLDRLALAAKSARLALQAALTAALAGSANIGAHPPKLRTEYLTYFEESRNGQAKRPDKEWVMSFADLLKAAVSEPLPWSNAPLSISECERGLLNRLTDLRHAVEHPKQSHHSIEPAFVAETLPTAARLAVEALGSVVHHLEPGCLARLEALHVRIAELCQTHLSRLD